MSCFFRYFSKIVHLKLSIITYEVMTNEAAAVTPQASEATPGSEIQPSHLEPASDSTLDAVPDSGRARRLRRAREETLAADYQRSGPDASPTHERHSLRVTTQRVVVLLQSAFRAM
jgi:hypothetical protein